MAFIVTVFFIKNVIHSLNLRQVSQLSVCELLLFFSYLSISSVFFYICFRSWWGELEEISEHTLHSLLPKDFDVYLDNHLEGRKILFPVRIKKQVTLKSSGYYRNGTEKPKMLVERASIDFRKLPIAVHSTALDL